MKVKQAVLAAALFISCSQVATTVPAGPAPAPTNAPVVTASPLSTPAPTVTTEATVRPSPTPSPKPSPTPEPTYTLIAGDQDWGRLVNHMGVGGDDPIGEILRWNPEVRKPYDLEVGQKLRIPGRGTAPTFPAYNRDFSTWKVIASQTSVFKNSSDNRIENIVNGANYINNWFEDGAHSVVLPRQKFSLNEVLGETTYAKGYKDGKAIAYKDGKLIEVDAVGGGICQVPSTIFPAILKAGLNVLERQNHSYYPYWWWEYPEGFGWDATTDSPNNPNLVFRNMYDFPIRLWATADREREKTLRFDVYGPPELVPYKANIIGPYFGTKDDKPTKLTTGSNWITGASVTTVIQEVYAGDTKLWSKPFESYYAAAPH